MTVSRTRRSTRMPSLIVIDSDRGIGNGQVIPAGPLRAPLAAQLDRTDALIVVGGAVRPAPSLR